MSLTRLFLLRSTAKYGEQAPESADLLFEYGKALLENAIAASAVLSKEDGGNPDDMDEGVHVVECGKSNDKVGQINLQMIIASILRVMLLNPTKNCNYPTSLMMMMMTRMSRRKKTETRRALRTTLMPRGRYSTLPE